MSLYSRNRTGNIGKVKYFLPGSRPSQLSKQPQHKEHKSSLQSQMPTRKHSNDENSLSHVNVSSVSKTDLSFEVIGVSDGENKNDSVDVLKMFPEGKEKEEFLKFVEGLKSDQNYQNTITMFTVMYYNQKKNGHKMETFL